MDLVTCVTFEFPCGISDIQMTLADAIWDP